MPRVGNDVELDLRPHLFELPRRGGRGAAVVAALDDHSGDPAQLLGGAPEQLTSDDKNVQLTAAKAWSKWEGEIVTLLPSSETVEHFTSPEFAVAVARIENHYMAKHGWLEQGQLLRGAAEKLRGIPGVIVQGRHDSCTPPVAAWKLKQAWPQVVLNIIPDAGHLFNEPGNLDALVRATDKFAGI